MKNAKQIVTSLPEYYLTVLVLLAGYTPPAAINPFAIALATILMLQIIFRNDLCGVFIAGLFILVNLYMLMALVSEYSESETFNSTVMQLLFGGTLLFALTMTASLIMIWRYAVSQNISHDNGFR